MTFRLFALFCLILSSCQVSRMIYYNFSGINDYRIFPFKEIKAPAEQHPFIRTEKGKFPSKVNDQPLEKFLKKNNTVAFLIIKNDTIQYEKYFYNYNPKSLVPSFSVAKSILSLLIGCAVDEGIISSVEEPVTAYIPELKKNNFDNVKIKHLLQMTSGIKFSEKYYTPFSDAARFYYGKNLRKKLLNMKLKNEPGKKFEYHSGNSQLLGLVLERALKGKSISQYLEEKIWKPLGMESDATWSLDWGKDPMEKTFCCLNATATDFAKIGRLFIQKGVYQDKKIVSEDWISRILNPENSEGSASYYQFSWWLPQPGKDIVADGHLGQYIYTYPNKKLIIVRLGKSSGKVDWWNFFKELAEQY